MCSVLLRLAPSRFTFGVRACARFNGETKPFARSAMSLRQPIQSTIRVEAGGGRAPGGAVLSSERVAGTKWLQLSNLTYKLSKDAGDAPPRRWDVAERATRAPGAADAVVVVARLRLRAADGDDPRVLLVKQFRPPVGAVTVELPAGLIDAGEAPAEAALRELREETGFVGTVTRVSKSQCLSPGMSAETVVVVEVDVTGQGNRALEDSEEVEVVSVPMARMSEALDWFTETQGCVVMHAVATLALGIQISL